MATSCAGRVAPHPHHLLHLLLAPLITLRFNHCLIETTLPSLLCHLSNDGLSSRHTNSSRGEPSYIPDLYPMENRWNDLKRRVEKRNATQETSTNGDCISMRSGTP